MGSVDETVSTDIPTCEVKNHNLMDDKTNVSAIDKALEELKKCQKEIDTLGMEEYQEILDKMVFIDKECKAMKKGLFVERNEVISRIPRFWFKAISNNPKLSFYIDDEEVKFLHYLEKVEVEQLEEAEISSNGFRVNFYFEEDNPYVADKVLSKDFTWSPEGALTTTSTMVTWKQDSHQQKDTEPKTHDKTKKVKYFDWLYENEGPLSINFLQLLELWQNPLQYYNLAKENQSNVEAEDSKEISKNLKEIEKYQSKINEINKRMDEELLKATSTIGENKEETKKQHYKDRAKIVNSIPNFWMTALSKHPDISRIINKDEIDCLKYLINIDVEEVSVAKHLESKMKINFYFAEENPYFENSVISKEFSRQSDGERCVNSTPIVWKEGKILFSQKKDVEPGCSAGEAGIHLFDWLSDDSNPESNSHISLPILQLWEDPLQYYLLPEVEKTDKDSTSAVDEEKETNYEGKKGE